MNAKHAKIMIADDDNSFCKAVTRLLDAYGFQVINVSRSIPVIKAITKEKPDLLLLDLYMPRAGGIEIIKTMNRLGINIPVIIISGNLNNLYIRILKENGVKHFLAKPVGMKTLIDTVKKVLEPDAFSKVDMQ